MPAYLIMVLVAFTVFIAVLGVYATRDMMADAHRRRALRQSGTAPRIQAIRESSSSGFSRT